MSFLNPLGALFLATLPVILGLYILRLKRRQVTVSTNLFWSQVLEDVEANTPFQRLRYSHLLLLQLLIALLFVLALMNPAITYSSTRGLDTIFVVDTTASMGAIEQGSSRLATVQKQLQQLIGDKDRHDRIAIIAAGRSPQLLTSLTAETAILRGAVEQLNVEPVSGNLSSAADLVLQVVQEARQRDAKPGAALPALVDSDGPMAQAILFTDDPVGFGAPPETELPIRWAVQPLGFANTVNVALLAASFTNPDPATSTMTLFLTTALVGPEPVEAELRVTREGTLLDLRTLTLQPGTEESHLFDGVPMEPGRFQLELKATRVAASREPVTDALEADNTAWMVYEPQSRFRILVLSSNGIYGLLLGQLPDVQVFQRSLSGGVPEGVFDLILVDGDLPLNAPPGNYLVVHSNNHDLLPVSVTGERERPVISDWKATDPLLRFVNPQTFRISKMMAAEPREWGRVVLDTNQGPAIVYGEQGQQRVVYWAFDPFATDLPFKATFPILLSSHVDYFRSRRGLQTLSTADLMHFSTPAAQVQVSRPDGSSDTISTQAGEELGLVAEQLGFWKLTAQTSKGTWSREYGVSLFAPSESMLPAGEFYSGDTGLATFDQARRGTHPLWRWLALAVLIFLLAEWWIYHQRIF